MDQKKGTIEGAEMKRIRVTLTSRNVKHLEKVCTDLVAGAKRKDIKVRGPVRMPTKNLSITTRKTPCGQGSKTWEHYEMHISKRVVDFHCPSDMVRQVTKITIEPDVDVEVQL
ncbi:40S ribosomal protein 20S [Carpediemonas membranifera]|nr:40S ribosomal protein 20S [Carpediemonas membranifera]|eukprot:KAG9397558.1 40S ribosomal protein 20S [Carpediemonas membranifera]